KRIIGDTVTVEADVFADGHDHVAALVRYRHGKQRAWRTVPMEPLVNDRWTAEFTVEEIGRYEFTVEGWIDPFATWQAGAEKKAAADVLTETDLQVGAGLLREGAERAKGAPRRRLEKAAEAIVDSALGLEER